MIEERVKSFLDAEFAEDNPGGFGNTGFDS